jgi:predicted short-subunit dehydrogenase-like oxidoreductase (DUF2520 family)
MAVASRARSRAEAAAAFIGAPSAVSYSELAECCPRLVIAVADDAIPAVESIIAGAQRLPACVLHTSGAHGPELLERLTARRVSCAALHPLQTIASPEQGAAALPGSAFAITGEGASLEWAERIVEMLDGRVLRIPAGRRALYHAAAVMASNYITALVDAALQAMRLASSEADDAALLRVIAPLVRASAENALAKGPLAALTGPVERGDTGVIARHREAMAEMPAGIVRLYQAAGLHVLDMARRKGRPAAGAAAIEEILTGGHE